MIWKALNNKLLSKELSGFMEYVYIKTKDLDLILCIQKYFVFLLDHFR